MYKFYQSNKVCDH